MSTTFFQLAFDATNAKELAQFWAQATGGKVEDGASPDEALVSGSDFPRMVFHRVPEGKTAKNRLHLDLIAADYDTEVARLVGLGASTVNELTSGGARWSTLADPEGNELDVIAG
jgi:predicted enzyme related to lactoylglutathione lyase